MTSNRASGPAATVPRPRGCGCLTRQRRYPSDLTDVQWAVIAPLLPVPLWQTELGGRPEKHHRRAIVDAILYLADNGIKRRAMPADFPPWRTVYGIFAAWQDDRVTGGLVDDLRAAARQAEGRDAEPSAGPPTPSRCTRAPTAWCPSPRPGLTRTRRSAAASATS